MQTCSRCNASSPDSAFFCVNCEADLNIYSQTVVALNNLMINPNVRKIRVTTDADACSHCHELMNTYDKNNVPHLPHAGCSHPNGCRCFYEPVVDEAVLIGKTAA
jgi:hypothetical protein